MNVDNSYLLKHAIDNVWCAPDQDNQYIIELHRVTKMVGEPNRVQLFNRKIMLPIANKRFHVFTADRLEPKQLRMLMSREDWISEKWFNIGELINDTSIFVNIYNEKGVEIPKFQSWYMLTKENALIFAFEENNKIPINYRSEVVYVRTYTNAYYGSVRDTGGEDTHYEYKKAVVLQDIIDIQNLSNVYKALPGYVYCYINGIYSDSINLLKTQIGDVIEFQYDSSVKVISRYKIGDLNIFNSTMDSCYKYLLLRNDDRNNIIDYLDDIDIHIVANIAPNKDLGIFFHRNNAASIRMVTHRDYSLMVDNVVYETNKLKELLDLPLINTDMFVEIKVRDNGFQRPLIYEDNRLHELYKLSYNDKLAAMLDINALDMWRAENLELSFYNKLMNIRLKEFGIEAIENAYGYNGISVVLANTPEKTHTYSGQQRIMVPQGLANNSTFYEYDIDGKLLGHYYQAIGSQYIATSPNTRMVEGIFGQGTDAPDAKFGNTDITLTSGYNYRVYMCYTDGSGNPNNAWRDVTGDEYYRIENGVLKNNGLIGNEFYMVRSDKTFLTMELDILPIAGTIYFTLAEMEDRGDGLEPNTLPVPMGELDIFLNGKSLIRGLDYFVKFPRIYIVNKEHLIQPAGSTPQNIKLRFTGFCNKDLSMDTIEDFGFIEHGFLSNNNRFDIRDDKVMRITVGGNLKTKTDIQFSEEHSGISVVNALNGRPYQIKDIVVPMTVYTKENVYALRAKSMVIDGIVQDYMSLKLPQPPRPAPSAIPHRYELVSPFFSHIINDMQSGQIDEITMNTLRSDMDVINFFRQYEFLLEFDPITKDLNDGYVIIHPHQLNNTINLSLLEMRLLTRLVKLYGNNKIELSPFVTLSA